MCNLILYSASVSKVRIDGVAWRTSTFRLLNISRQLQNNDIMEIETGAFRELANLERL